MNEFSCILKGRNTSIRIAVLDIEASLMFVQVCVVQYASELVWFSSMKHIFLAAFVLFKI
jgi:hypothetical protein